jgi:hypothetical protein
MSLAVVIKGPEGLVLAADSRVTLQGKRGNEVFTVNYDNATKLLTFEGQSHLAAVTYGAAVIGARTAHSFLPEFEVKDRVKEGRLPVEEFCKELRDFFKERWESEMPKNYSGPDMTFIVGGFDEGEAYGKVFLFSIPRADNVIPRNAGDFGMTWGGQLELASRMIHGFDPNLPALIENTLTLDGDKKAKLREILKQLEFPIPYQVLPLQDSINLAISMLRSTIIFQSLAAGVRGVGGPLEVAVVTRVKGVKYIQKKELRGEQGVYGGSDYREYKHEEN